MNDTHPATEDAYPVPARKLPTGSKLVCRRGRSYILMGDGSVRREIFKDGRVRTSKKARLRYRRARLGGTHE